MSRLERKDGPMVRVLPWYLEYPVLVLFPVLVTKSLCLTVTPLPSCKMGGIALPYLSGLYENKFNKSVEVLSITII